MEKNIFNPANNPVFARQALFMNSPLDISSEEYEKGIDLNEQLIKNKPSTYFMRVNSEAMIEAGIRKGDVVIVDRALEAKNGKVVIGVLNGEMMIRYFEEHNKKIRMIPATKKLAALEIDPSADFYIWGVVTYVIHGF
ncbi:MAG: LexA family protein [Flavisolibacter sp.]